MKVVSAFHNWRNDDDYRSSSHLSEASAKVNFSFVPSFRLLPVAICAFINRCAALTQGGDPFVKSAIYVRYDRYYKLLNIISS